MQEWYFIILKLKQNNSWKKMDVKPMMMMNYRYNGFSSCNNYRDDNMRDLCYSTESKINSESYSTSQRHKLKISSVDFFSKMIVSRTFPKIHNYQISVQLQSRICARRRHTVPFGIIRSPNFSSPKRLVLTAEEAAISTVH